MPNENGTRLNEEPTPSGPAAPTAPPAGQRPPTAPPAGQRPPTAPPAGQRPPRQVSAPTEPAIMPNPTAPPAVPAQRRASASERMLTAYDRFMRVYHFSGDWAQGAVLVIRDVSDKVTELEGKKVKKLMLHFERSKFPYWHLPLELTDGNRATLISAYGASIDHLLGRTVKLRPVSVRIGKNLRRYVKIFTQDADFAQADLADLQDFLNETGAEVEQLD